MMQDNLKKDLENDFMPKLFKMAQMDRSGNISSSFFRTISDLKRILPTVTSAKSTQYNMIRRNIEGLSKTADSIIQSL